MKGWRRFVCTTLHISMYSRLSLSRLRLSQSKSLIPILTWKFKNRYQNIVEKRDKGVIAPKEWFLLFSTIFSIYIYILVHKLQESNYIFISEMWLFDLLFSILQIWYVEIRISRNVSESPLDFEIPRVDCVFLISINAWIFSRNIGRPHYLSKTFSFETIW